MNSTLRPSRPPRPLTSSTHMRSASSAAWPPAPSEPVCGMLMPILTGGCCASTAPETASSAATSSPAILPMILIVPSWFGTATNGGARSPGLSISILEIPAEILRHRGAPHIEGVLRRVVLRLPVRVARAVVDVAEVFGEAAPRIADVVEEVGADDVPAEAPAVAVALLQQAAGADADLVHVGDFEARVVVARPVVLQEGEQVVIAAAFAAAQEADDVLRAVRELH